MNRRPEKGIQMSMSGSGRRSLVGRSGGGGGRVTALLRVAGLLALTIAALLALSVGSASAAELRPRHFTFGGTGSGSGQFSGFGLLPSSPLAVDQSSGDVYVGDPGNNRIEKFGPSGSFILMFGGGVDKTTGADVCTAASGDTCGPGAPDPSPSGNGHGFFGNGEGIAGLAVDPVTHDVYATDRTAQLVERFDASGNFIAQFTAPTDAQVRGGNALAVSSSSAVYVADGNGCGCVQKFDSAGVPDPLTPEIGAGVLSSAFSVALDSAGNLYVVDRGNANVQKFDPSGTLVNSGNFAGGLDAGNSPAAVATDPTNGDVYVVDDGLQTVLQYDSAGNLLSDAPPVAPFSLAGTRGVGLDQSTGDLLLTDAATDTVGAFGPTATFPDPITGEATEVHPTTATLNGEVNPAGTEASYQFEYGTTSNYGQLAPASPAAVGNDNADHPESAALAGLQPNTTYHFRIDAINAQGTNPGADATFRTTGPPAIESQSASGITRSCATLEATVDPDGLDTSVHFEYGTSNTYGSETAPVDIGEGSSGQPAGTEVCGLTLGTTYHFRAVATNSGGSVTGADTTFATVPALSIDATSASEVTATTVVLETEVNPRGLPTTYSFQYGTTTAYGSETPSPPAPLGEGLSDVTRTAFISGLAPGTAYHFRVIATNALGTVEGPDTTFTTQPAASSSLLPDNRGWELVSPALKQGVPLEAITKEGGVIQAAATGSAITYIARGSIVTEAGGNRSGLGNSQDLSTRGPAGGWSTIDISTPHHQPSGFLPGALSEYQLFSSDLSLGAVQPFGATRLSPEAGEKTPYLRLSDGSYDPLVSPANVPFGTHFGGTEIKPEIFEKKVEFQTATPDLSHILLTSPTSLVEGFENGGEPAIYEWSAGALIPVSFVPSGGASLCGGAAPACRANNNAFVGNNNQNVRNAISTDGTRVIFSQNSGDLYLRDIPRGETLRVDAAQGIAEPEFGDAVFQTASSDGSQIFFTDAERLTAGSTAAKPKPDLYMCQITIEAGHLACSLTDLTENTLDRSEPANVLGAVNGAAQDGSSIYFVADGALTAGAVSGDCNESPHQTASNLCNLYRYDAETGSLRLVAVLSGADYPDWAPESTGKNLGQLTARVSPNGNYLAFMSERPLTGYDNRDAASGERDQEVFLYDGAAPAAEALICASCNPSGARPKGLFDPISTATALAPALLVDRPVNWGGHTLAASIPGWTSVDLGHALYQSRYLSDSGRLFFNAADALVPQDTNGTEDVYQYEPPGVGNCSAASPGFAPRDGGCVDLISSGTSAEESAFMDADEKGENVFFLTASRLTAKDEDTAFDLYDARVGGGEVAPVKPVECSGDACQQPAVPPNDATPGSLTFNGAGNQLQCPKGKVKQKGKCVKKQSKKNHKKSHKKHKKNAKKSAKRAGSNHGGHK
jgi:hypothetical protein